MKFAGRQRLPIVKTYCLHSYSVDAITYLLLSSFCIELFIFHVQISYIPIMIIRTILATCFSILQRCCTRSLPSGFRYFQPESARKIHARPHRRSALFRTTSVRAEQPRNSSEKVKFSMSCTVHRYDVNLSDCACMDNSRRLNSTCLPFYPLLT